MDALQALCASDPSLLHNSLVYIGSDGEIAGVRSLICGTNLESRRARIDRRLRGLAADERSAHEFLLRTSMLGTVDKAI